MNISLKMCRILTCGLLICGLLQVVAVEPPRVLNLKEIPEGRLNGNFAVSGKAVQLAVFANVQYILQFSSLVTKPVRKKEAAVDPVQLIPVKYGNDLLGYAQIRHVRKSETVSSDAKATFEGASIYLQMESEEQAQAVAKALKVIVNPPVKAEPLK